MLEVREQLPDLAIFTDQHPHGAIRMRVRLAVLFVTLAFLVGCPDEGPIQPTGPKLNVTPAVVTVETGADPIPLSAVPQNGTVTGNIAWEIFSGNSGTLDATSGALVDFVPSALGTPGGTVVVKATGTVGGTTQSGASTITVKPSTRGRIFLNIELNGAPGAVQVAGPGLSPPLVFTQSGATPIIDAGTYSITPDAGVVVVGSTVTSVFDGLVSIDGGTPDLPTANVAVVANAQSTARVAFLLHAGNGRLWAPAAGGLLGFTENDLFVTQVPQSGFPASGARAIAFDADGNLWATAPTGIQKYDASTLGQPNATPSVTVTVNDATGVAIHGDTVLVASCADKKVYQFSRTSPGNPTALISGLNCPWGLAFDSAGKIWVADQGAGKVSQYPAGGGSSLTSVTFADAFGVAIDSSGGVWASSCSGNQVQELVPLGTAITDPTSLLCPGGLAFDNSGALWVLSKGQSPDFNGTLVRISGGVVGSPITPLHQVDFGGIAFSPASPSLPLHQ